MKLKHLLPFITLILTSLITNAQRDGKNNLKLSWLTGGLGVQYERSFAKQFSAVAHVGYSTLTYSLNNSEDSESAGLAYFIQPRYYFMNDTDDYMEGIYLGPYLYVMDTRSSNPSARTLLTSIGGQVGYQWVLKFGMTIDINAGIGSLNIDSSDDALDFNYGGAILPMLGIALGYNF